ncbi:MAG: hypothetical protein KDK76_01175 [Chlamydiia bacterium]|nr:hypothetical protein [Chlamydiia bacterium]
MGENIVFSGAIGAVCFLAGGAVVAAKKGLTYFDLSPKQIALGALSSGLLSNGIVTGGGALLAAKCTPLAVKTLCSEHEGEKALQVEQGVYGTLPFLLNLLSLRIVHKKISATPLTRLNVIAHSALSAISIFVYLRSLINDEDSPIQKIRSAIASRSSSGEPLSEEEIEFFWHQKADQFSDGGYLSPRLVRRTPPQILQLIEFKREDKSVIDFLNETAEYASKNENAALLKLADTYEVLPPETQTPDSREGLSHKIQKLLPPLNSDAFWNELFTTNFEGNKLGYGPAFSEKAKKQNYSEAQMYLLLENSQAREPMVLFDYLIKNMHLDKPAQLIAARVYLKLTDGHLTETFHSLKSYWFLSDFVESVYDGLAAQTKKIQEEKRGIHLFYEWATVHPPWKDSVSWALTYGAISATAAGVGALGLKTFSLINQHFPSARGALPAGATMAGAYLLTSATFHKFEDEDRVKYSSAIAVVAGALFTPTLSRLFFEKQVSYMAGGGYTLLGAAVNHYYKNEED